MVSYGAIIFVDSPHDLALNFLRRFDANSLFTLVAAALYKMKIERANGSRPILVERFIKEDRRFLGSQEIEIKERE